jgi:hypothetical protein
LARPDPMSPSPITAAVCIFDISLQWFPDNHQVRSTIALCQALFKDFYLSHLVAGFVLSAIFNLEVWRNWIPARLAGVYRSLAVRPSQRMG